MRQQFASSDHKRLWAAGAVVAEHIEAERVDPSFVISHRRWSLSRAADAYDVFNDKRDDCTKVVLSPTR